MEINLYINKSSRNTVDKTLDNRLKLENCVFKFPTDILNPTIRLEMTYGTGLSSSYNYCYIPILNRYYYIQNITIFNNGIIDIYLNVDVLMSYKNKILTTVCEVTRNEFTYVSNIIDDRCHFTHNVTVENLAITNLAFPSDSVKLSRTPTTNIKLTWLTDTTGIGLIGSYLELPQTCNDIGKFAKSLVPNEVASASVLLTVDQAKEFLTQVFNSEVSISSIKSLIALPIDFDSSGNLVAVSDTIIRINGSNGMSNKSVTGTLYKSNYNVIKVQVARFKFDDCIATSSNPNPFDWQKKSPYTVYELFAPFHGFIELNYEQCKGQTLDLVYFVHLESDKQTMVLFRESDGKVLFESDIDIGYKIGVSATNVYENNRIKEGYAQAFAIKALVGVGMTVAGFAGMASNPAMGMLAISGMATAATAAGTFIEQNKSLFDRATNVSLSTAENGLANAFTPYLRTQYVSAEQDYNTTAWKHVNGLPLYEMQGLINIKGFTVIDKCKIDYGLEYEQKEIMRFFNEGIYLPEVI